MEILQNSATLAAVLLLCAGIIHNYSFMCRKLPRGRIKTAYPSSSLGQLLLDLSWLLMAGFAFVVCYRISLWLCGVAVVVYFLALPFVLQPPLAKLLGFASLTDYVDYIDGLKKS